VHFLFQKITFEFPHFVHSIFERVLFTISLVERTPVNTRRLTNHCETILQRNLTDRSAVVTENGVTRLCDLRVDVLDRERFFRSQRKSLGAN